MTDQSTSNNNISSEDKKQSNQNNSVGGLTPANSQTAPDTSAVDSNSSTNSSSNAGTEKQQGLTSSEDTAKIEYKSQDEAINLNDIAQGVENTNEQSLSQAISAGESFLLILPYYINYDIATSAGIIYKFFKDKSKKVDILAYEQPNDTYLECLKEFSVNPDNILYSLKPIAYTITIKDAKDDINVEWEKNNDELTFKLIPKIKEINFSNIRFGKQGSLYDRVITFNSPNFTDINKELYEKHQNQLDKYRVLTLGNIAGSYSYAKGRFTDENIYSLSYFLKKHLAGKEQYELDDKYANNIALSVVFNSRGFNYLQKYLSDTDFRKFTDDKKVSLSKLYRSAYYEKTDKENKLLEAVIKNVAINTSKKTIYSFISPEQISQGGFTEKDLKNFTHIPFNIPSKFRYAVLGYKYQDKIRIFVESNDGEELYSFINKNGGYGGKYSGMFVMEGNLTDQVKKVIDLLPEYSEPQDEKGQNLTYNEDKSQDSKPNDSSTHPIGSDSRPASSASSGITSATENKTNTQNTSSSNQPSSNSLLYKDNKSLTNAPSQDNNNGKHDKSDQKQTENITPKQTQMQSQYSTPPFKQANDYTVDANAEAMKKPTQGRSTFDQYNPPFNRAY